MLPHQPNAPAQPAPNLPAPSPAAPPAAGTTAYDGVDYQPNDTDTDPNDDTYDDDEDLPPVTDHPLSPADRTRLTNLLNRPPAPPPTRHSRNLYRPTLTLIDHLDATHRRCRYIGCGRPARNCDKDHIHAWRPNGRGGRTCARNMIPLCRRHHRLKHSPGWNVTLHPDRSVTWTTPTGHQWTDPPPTVWD